MVEMFIRRKVLFARNLYNYCPVGYNGFIKITHYPISGYRPPSVTVSLDIQVPMPKYPLMQLPFHWKEPSMVYPDDVYVDSNFQ